jgi:hypothetical protein
MRYQGGDTKAADPDRRACKQSRGKSQAEGGDRVNEVILCSLASGPTLCYRRSAPNVWVVALI